MSIKVFLVTNFRLLLHGIDVLLSQHSERFDLIGNAEQLGGLSEVIVSIRPDLLLLDIDTEPAQIPRQIEVLKAVASDVRILLLTRLKDGLLQDKAIMAGARGIINYRASLELFLNAMEKVHDGQIWLDRDSIGRLWGEVTCQNEIKENRPVVSLLENLSARERKILSTVLNHGDESIKEIAECLYISESTLRSHLTSIYKKCRVSSRCGLLVYSIKNGLAERLATELNSTSVRE